MLAPFGEGAARLRQVPHRQQLTMRIHLAPQGGKQSSQPRPRLTSALVARREGFEPNPPHRLHDESPYRRWFLQLPAAPIRLPEQDRHDRGVFSYAAVTAEPLEALYPPVVMSPDRQASWWTTKPSSHFFNI